MLIGGRVSLITSCRGCCYREPRYLLSETFAASFDLELS
jgi:hypothetical protein